MQLAVSGLARLRLTVTEGTQLIGERAKRARHS